MSRQHTSDFEIGYEYVRKHYSSLAKQSSQQLWELGMAYLQVRGPTGEVSRGMGFYFLESGIKMRLSEIAQLTKKEDSR